MKMELYIPKKHINQKKYRSDAVFTSNGVRVLLASGSETQISFLRPEVLKEKFGAELVLENVKLSPYWQVGETTGSIYKLPHFPLDGSEYDYPGLYVFNVLPNDEERVCDMIVGGNLLDGFGHDGNGLWKLEIPDDIDEAVKRTNAYLQVVIDKTV